MAKEKKGEEGKEGKPAKRLHLHQVRTVEAEDGTHVHHHTYKNKRGDHYTLPEREAAATSKNAEEAGQHVTEQFGMNTPPGQEEEEPQEAAAQPGAGGQVMPQGM